MKLYKVLRNINGVPCSPFQKYAYEIGKEYFCDDFDADSSRDCSRGYYATEIDGLVYTFRNLPSYEVYTVEVGGLSVEIDQFKRRYQQMTILERISNDEVKRLAEADELRAGYKLSEALFPVHPLRVLRGDTVTDEEMVLLIGTATGYREEHCRKILREKVVARFGENLWVNARESVWESVGANVIKSISAGLWAKLRNNIELRMQDSTYASVWAYITSLFISPSVNPFQPCVDLWRSGLVPSFDGKVWRLHAGEKAKVVWKGTF